MSNANDYRGFAAKLRRDAEDPALRRLREDNLRAAARWESLAEEVEHANEVDRNFSERNR